MAATPEAFELKARLKQAGDALPETLRVRIHRALSWLARAEKESRDHDARFIFLWIAFNAAYAQEFGPEQAERAQLRAFLTKLVAVDGGKALHRLLFEKYTGPVRLLIENKFVFEPFWRALRTHDASNEWGMRFQHEKKAALKAVMSNETVTVLGVVFDRLYVLRNQLVHGGATWNGQVNRPQVRDGAELLHSIVPAIVALMLEHPELDLGSISFPVIGAVPRA
ncbi:MAG TPA: hypothetical protein VM369_04905 [Candidatus Binatia bacterium]|nr:hypothetical protein [Candidatus Binatia bacterium]